MPSNGGGAMSFSDRFFSYETFKVLRVRDRRLGGLYRLFQATILIYIASSIIFQQRYLKTENVINGAVRVTLKAPSDGVATPDYCQPTQPCLFWDENDILYEPGVDGALVTTRAQITQFGPFNNQSLTNRQCDANFPTSAVCRDHPIPSTLLLPTSLVADIERFTLMLEHSIRGQASGVQMRSGNMEYGVLRDSESGEIVKTFTDESRIVPATAGAALLNDTMSPYFDKEDTTGKTIHLAGDVMTVGEFLKAAGVHLDELSGSPTANINETVRSSGVVVIVVIQYAAKGWNPNRISYEYLPKAIPDQEYKVIETIRDFRGGNRVEINRHGIRIVFSQAGQLGQFSLMTLLTNLVAAVALFKVANIIVELMMLRLHPRKKLYDRAKFESARDGPLKQRGLGNASEATLTATLQESNSGHFQAEANQGEGGDTTKGKNSKVHGSSSGLEESSAHQGYVTGGSSMVDSDSNLSDSDQESDGDVEAYKTEDPRQHGKGCLAVDTLTKAKQNTLPDEGQVRSRTPISSNGTAGRSFGTFSQSSPRMSAFDWSRNGSRSALGRDASPSASTPKVTHRPLFGGSTEEVEVETRFGPIRPNEFKGFNPGGIALSTPPLSPSPTQTKIAYSFTRGSAASGSSSSELLLSMSSSPASLCGAALSSPSMQAVSPSPVYFGPGLTSLRSSVSPQEQRHGGQHRTPREKSSTKQNECFGICPGKAALNSSLSSSSLSSLASSSSSSSDALINSMTPGAGSSLESPSTLFINAPESPFREHSDGCDSLRATPVQPSPGARGESSLRHGHKKRRKNADSTLNTLLSLSTSEGPTLTRTRTMFNLGAPSNLSQVSLSISNAKVGSSSSKKDTSEAGPSKAIPTAPLMDFRTDEEFSSRLASFRLPMPALPSQSMSDHSIAIESTTRTFSATSSSALHGKAPHGKPPVTHPKDRALRPSFSSPSLLGSSVPRVVEPRPQHAITPSSTTTTTHATCSAARVTETRTRFATLPMASEGAVHSSSPVPMPSNPMIVQSTVSTSVRSLQSSEQASSTCTRRSSVPLLSSSDSINNASPSGSLRSTKPGTATEPVARVPVQQQATPLTLYRTLPIPSYSSLSSSGSGILPVTGGTASATPKVTIPPCPHPTSTFFTSPITARCTTTLAGTGVRVLGRTITMVTADNKTLLLRRSEPLILNEGVGEEKAARM